MPSNEHDFIERLRIYHGGPLDILDVVHLSHSLHNLLASSHGDQALEPQDAACACAFLPQNGVEPRLEPAETGSLVSSPVTFDEAEHAEG